MTAAGISPPPALASSITVASLYMGEQREPIIDLAAGCYHWEPVALRPWFWKWAESLRTTAWSASRSGEEQGRADIATCWWRAYATLSHRMLSQHRRLRRWCRWQHMGTSKMTKNPAHWLSCSMLLEQWSLICAGHTQQGRGEGRSQLVSGAPQDLCLREERVIGREAAADTTQLAKANGQTNLKNIRSWCCKACRAQVFGSRCPGCLKTPKGFDIFNTDMIKPPIVAYPRGKKCGCLCGCNPRPRCRHQCVGCRHLVCTLHCWSADYEELCC